MGDFEGLIKTFVDGEKFIANFHYSRRGNIVFSFVKKF